MVWANTAALSFWGVTDLDELLQRDFRDMTVATRQWFKNHLPLCENGGETMARWTFYPGGRPQPLDIVFRGLTLEKGAAGFMLEYPC